MTAVVALVDSEHAVVPLHRLDLDHRAAVALGAVTDLHGSPPGSGSRSFHTERPHG